MKKATIYLLFGLLTITGFACNSAKSETNSSAEPVVSDEIVHVYYFHYSRRCATCNAVEKITTETITAYYGEQEKAGKIVFESINLDEETSVELAEKHQITGQTLLFVSGNEKVNLTNAAFMYAGNQPDKLKVKVKATLNKLVK